MKVTRRFEGIYEDYDIPLATQSELGIMMYANDDEVESETENKAISPLQLNYALRRHHTIIAIANENITLNNIRPCFIQLFWVNGVVKFKKAIDRIDGAIVDNVSASDAAIVYIVGRTFLAGFDENEVETGIRYMVNLATDVISPYSESATNQFYIGIGIGEGDLRFEDDFSKRLVSTGTWSILQDKVFCGLNVSPITWSIMQDKVFAKLPQPTGSWSILQDKVFAKLPIAAPVTNEGGKIVFELSHGWYGSSHVQKAQAIRNSYPNIRLVIPVQATWNNIVSINNGVASYDYSQVGNDLTEVVSAGLKAQLIVVVKCYDGNKKHALTYENGDRKTADGGGQGDDISFSSPRMANTMTFINGLCNYIASHQYFSSISSIKFDSSATAEFGYPINGDVINMNGTVADVNQYEITNWRQWLANKYGGWSAGQANKSLSTALPYGGTAGGAGLPFHGDTSGTGLGKDWFYFRNFILDYTYTKWATPAKNIGIRVVLDNGSFTDIDHYRNMWAMLGEPRDGVIDWYKHNPDISYPKAVVTKSVAGAKANQESCVEWTWMDNSRGLRPTNDANFRNNYINAVKGSIDNGVTRVSLAFFDDTNMWGELDLVLASLNSQGYLQDKNVQVISGSVLVDVNVSHARNNNGYDNTEATLQSQIAQFGTANVKMRVIADEGNYKYLENLW